MKKTVQKGLPAPNFTLSDINGRDVSLSDFRGKVVLLEFWATWCPPCIESVPELIMLQERYKEKGFTIVAISLDKGADKNSMVAAFSDKFKINYPILFADENIIDSYQIISIPTSVILDRDGVVIHIYSSYGMDFEDHLSKEIEKVL
ncbi:MAG: TlpA family protein disulfide reductase [Nitrospiraceae bacterium]|nr:MAG: TlpA family protein disulfide reductase [Nitrospiraceae bacterium]